MKERPGRAACPVVLARLLLTTDSSRSAQIIPLTRIVFPPHHLCPENGLLISLRRQAHSTFLVSQNYLHLADDAMFPKMAFSLFPAVRWARDAFIRLERAVAPGDRPNQRLRRLAFPFQCMRECLAWQKFYGAMIPYALCPDGAAKMARRIVFGRSTPTNVFEKYFFMIISQSPIFAIKTDSLKLNHYGSARFRQSNREVGILYELRTRSFKISVPCFAGSAAAS
jgi:hypothetical protein